jgi:uncharacterized protein (DUF488 family)
MAHSIYSIGHSNKSLAEFLNELKTNHIDTLVDLRTSPYSSYVPYFSKDQLKASLEDEGIKYVFFGDKLGGRPPEGIDVFITTNRFKENVTELLSRIDGKTAALMCSEADYEQCHRRFIIREIECRGIKVTIIGKTPDKQKDENKDQGKSKQMSLGEF